MLRVVTHIELPPSTFNNLNNLNILNFLNNFKPNYRRIPA